MSSDATPGPPELETLERIERQLATLIPEAKRWRRTRLLTWLTMGALAAVVAISVVGWKAYRDDRAEDCRDRATARAELREYNAILIGAATGADPDAETRAVIAELDAALDEALPPLTC